MSDHDDTTCPHLFEAATLSAQLIEAEEKADKLRSAASRIEQRELDALAVLDEARALLREVVTETSGHEHWDREMTRGANCPLCIRQRAFFERVRAFLAGAGS